MLRLVLDLWISGSQVTLPAGAGEVTAKVSKVKSVKGEAWSASHQSLSCSWISWHQGTKMHEVIRLYEASNGEMK